MNEGKEGREGGKGGENIAESISSNCFSLPLSAAFPDFNQIRKIGEGEGSAIRYMVLQRFNLLAYESS